MLTEVEKIVGNLMEKHGSQYTTEKLYAWARKPLKMPLALLARAGTRNVYTRTRFTAYTIA